MRPGLAARKSAKDRFLREAKAAAAITHDHIVTIHQVGEDRNIPFIAMQFLRGESLQSRLQREQRLSQREVLRIGREVASGLAAAHKHGLIHRDIKPDNIWLEAESARVKILDFGLVRAATDNSGLTQSGVVLGTPRYMAPEQAQGQDVDARCDLFSLGCVLYQIAAGKPPFEGSNLTAILIAVAQANPEPLEQLCPDLHPDVSRLIVRLLSKQRDERPASAVDVSQAIAQIETHIDSPNASRDSGTSHPLPAVQTPTRMHVLYGGAAIGLMLAALLGLWVFGNRPEVGTQNGQRASSVASKGEQPASAQGERQHDASASLRDREAAQWVLDVGGEVALDLKTRSGVFVKAPATLPAEAFSVTWINLAGNRVVADDDLGRLKGLESLAMLHLQNTAIGDAGTAQLTDLPELVFVNFVATQVTDQGLVPLGRLPKLSRLYVSRCRISDAAMPILREMKLTELTLDGTDITFSGLQQLAENSTLRNLTVAHLELTSDEVEQLKQLLPNCRINTE
jgi:hypothetical protein